MIVVGEMFVLALLARCLYKKPHTAFKLDKKDKLDSASSPYALPEGMAVGEGPADREDAEEVVKHNDDSVRPVGQERYHKSPAMVT